MSHQIPPVVPPDGKHWSQPERDLILVDDEYAVMERSTLDKMTFCYNEEPPKCAYPGKMWYTVRHIPEFHFWMGWFGHSDTSDFVSVNYRKILILF